MKYAIIGTGNISNTYVHAIAATPGSEVVACVSRSGRSPSANPGIPAWPSLELVPVDFDAVIVATPNGLHTEGVLAAARLGKHVLTEKPLGIREEEMDRALAACEQAGVTLAVAYQRRTAPDNRAIKALLDSGALGKVFRPITTVATTAAATPSTGAAPSFNRRRTTSTFTSGSSAVRCGSSACWIPLPTRWKPRTTAPPCCATPTA